MYTWVTTFTVKISVREWMPDASELSKRVLLNYFKDVASGKDFRSGVTACAMESSPALWFTFEDYSDFVDFTNELTALWNDGEWLSYD